MPRPVRSTDWTNIAAKPKAIRANTSATMTNVTLDPLRDTPPPSAARFTEVPDINVLLHTPTAPEMVDETSGRLLTIDRTRGRGTSSS
ncbi:hypothetical protein GCM10010168_67180 [Actinoplanes ianthinogenes]|uniref:Uncharacterized protein n=1 Tax=Actinoplanes ianthinogenes TaxID=122358 RepID=A0ABM7LX67_9ACTN|nr:hypothetical protein Aiant_45720 [Actinoplanes ianthinogenes]GGR39160.1 hypothetical protein GCM10010168_67180 [Actinoplanes ianthinogenes]